MGSGDGSARREPRSPSPNRARAAGRSPTSPAAAGHGLPPDTPPGAAQLGPAPEAALHERVDAVTTRLVGLEAAVLSLQQGAQAALAELLEQAKQEFAGQHSSLAALRTDVQQEAATLRTYLGGTRQEVA